MESRTRIYENPHPDAKVSIDELPTQLEFVTLSPTMDKQYAKFFLQNGGVRSERSGGAIVWTFDKSNQGALNLLDKMTGVNLASKFREEKKVEKKLGLPSPAKPALLQLPGQEPGGNILALMQQAAAVPQEMPVAGQYPRLIYDNKTAGVQIVDYSEKAVAMFVPQEWGKDNSQDLKKAGGTFNWRLKSSPAGNVTSPGWIFAKSNKAAKEFLKSLTKQDIMALATPTPNKGRGWQPSAAPPSPGRIQAPSSAGRLAVPGIPQPQAVQQTPADLLSELFNMLQVPMAKATRKDLIDPTGVGIRVGFYGNEEDVGKLVAEYFKEYPERFSTGIDIDVTSNGNRVVVVSRSAEADE